MVFLKMVNMAILTKWPFWPFGHKGKIFINLGKIGILSISIKNVAVLWKPEFHLMIFKRVTAKLRFWVNFQYFLHSKLDLLEKWCANGWIFSKNPEILNLSFTYIYTTMVNPPIHKSTFHEKRDTLIHTWIMYVFIIMLKSRAINKLTVSLVGFLR